MYIKKEQSYDVITLYIIINQLLAKTKYKYEIESDRVRQRKKEIDDGQKDKE